MSRLDEEDSWWKSAEIEKQLTGGRSPAAVRQHRKSSRTHRSRWQNAVEFQAIAGELREQGACEFLHSAKFKIAILH